MPLTLLPAQESDAPRIAAIHMAAFGTNAMLHAQFPTRTLRAGLQDAIVDKTIKDIRDAKTAVLVVRDCLDDLHLHREKGKGHDRDQNQGQGQGQKQNENEKGQEQEKESNSSNNNSVISYARWNLPVHQSEGYVEPPWCFPEGTKWDVLKMWTDKVEGAQERVLGKEPCYHLSLIGTDPSHERRGAASLLIQWGLERSKRDNIPAYLESTMNAVPLYQRHGFKVAEVISMVVDGVGDGVVKDEDEDEDKDGGDGEGEEGRRRGKKEEEEKVYYYEEMCLLFRPDGRCGDQL